jgi:NodT family efflux transporter outer membrane factor (OMF) lipoprotein
MIFRAAACCIVASSLAGCAVGPDFARPAPPDATSYARDRLPDRTVSADAAGGEAQNLIQAMDIPGQWWTLFRSGPLNRLIEAALAHNHDLAAAQAALVQANETLKAGEASFFPTLQASYQPTRQKNATGTLAPTLASNQPIYTLHTAQLSISYVPDLFGGTRRQVESLAATAEEQRFEVEATYLTLTANLAEAAVGEASLRGQIAATERLVAIEREITDITRGQRRLGFVADADVVAQEALQAATEAELPPLQKQLAVERDLITALCGNLPDAEPDDTIEPGSLHLPDEVPVTLPSKLVEQRPDIRAAEAELHAATAKVGVAIANFLPQITLSASMGSASTDLSGLFRRGNGFWTLAGDATQTLFDGGALLHDRRAADAALDQAASQYQSTVVTAFQNVADSLHAITLDAEAMKTAVAAEQAAGKSLDYVKGQLALGAVSHLAVLNAEQAYQQAVALRVQAEAARYSDTIALFQALGGGWWNRSDIP